ncbi:MULTISPECIES: response regulator transcription factor [Methylobacteriaceae]|uniref:LytR/AlgR family response regulator transcription factor n=1 Tax=Methylobacteriaceae TaxID=119045 RepID=UPI00074F921A|nr:MULTISPECIES: response regulator transcription factor [Methylobacteriaceae]AMB44492.1 transcriptional regulator [Methylobacterium sp. AMS5]TFZ60602.1 response regulator transcription factor [Methylorubrum sp. Q1]
MLRLILVDDEPLSRQRLRYLLDGRADVTLVGEAGSVSDAVRLIAQERPDGVFLDVEMGDGTGFDVLGRLVHPPCIVFVTAYSHHAVDAFGVQAVDYLLKPVRQSRLEEALRRLEAALRRAEPRIPDKAPAMFHMRLPGRALSVPHDAVVLLSAERDYTRIVLEGRPPLLIRQTLGRSAAELPDQTFHRLGRSLIVNLDRLCEVDQKSRDTTWIRLAGWDQGVLLGRAASDDLRRILSSSNKRPAADRPCP